MPAAPVDVGTALRTGVGTAEVVLIMGIPGAGKSRASIPLEHGGYLRLNRDKRGGSPRTIVDALDEALGAGTSRVVLDNTYLRRAARNEVIEVARRHGATVRCVWLDTPLAQAQINLTRRILDSMGTLPDAAELRAAARRQPGLLSPTSQMRAQRELEPPGDDEGFDAVVRIPFEREPSEEMEGSGRRALLIAAAACNQPDGADPVAAAVRSHSGPVLLFDWDPDGNGALLQATVSSLVGVLGGGLGQASDERSDEALSEWFREWFGEGVGAPMVTARCPHPGGPPTCWCRPPLPGLALAFARAHSVNLATSTLFGSNTAHRSMAQALGATYVQI